MEEQPTVAQPSAEPPPRRGPWRRRIALVVAALVLLLLLAVALAPRLVSAFGRERVEAAFAQRFQGRLELESLELAWSGRQRVEGARLLDPGGAEVARVTLDLPGLWSLLVGRGRRLGRIEVVASADLVADEGGVTNLDRALALRPAPIDQLPPVAPDVPAEPGDGQETGVGLQQTLERLEAELDLRVERLSWSDATARAAGGPMVVEGFEASLTVARGGSLSARAQGRLSGSASGELTLSARLERPFAAASAAEPPRLDLDLRLAELPVALIDTLTRQEGRLLELLGERVTLQARATGTPQAGDASLQLDATRAQATARARLADGVLRALEGWALDASLDLDPGSLERLLAGRLPEGVALARRALGDPLRVAVPRLSLPIADALDARAQGGDLVDALLTKGELGVSATLGAWAVVAPQRLGGEEPLNLEEVAAELRLVPSGGAARADLTLRARVAEPGAGTLSLSLGSADLLGLLAATRAQGQGRAEARLELRGLSTPLAERLAQVAGLLQPALGDALDLDVALDGVLAADGGLSGRLQAGVQARGRHLTARLDGTLPADERADGTLPALEARGELSGLELAYDLLPPTLRPHVAELLGGSLAFDLTTGAGSPGASSIALQLTAARTQLALAGELAPGALHLRGEPGLTLSLRPTGAALQALVGASLPAGAALELRDEGAAATLSVRFLDLPLPREGDPQSEAPAAALAEARGELTLALPALVWRQPPAAGAGTAVPVELSKLLALVTLAPGTGLTAHVSGLVSGQSGEGIDLSLSAPDVAALFSAAGPSVPVELQVEARGLPTALVDAFAAQEGLLVDVLGPSIDLQASGRWPAAGAPLRASLRSSGASVEVHARLEDGVLIADQAQGLEASTPLSPLYSRRVVGRLMPLLVGLTKPEGAPPVGLTVANFRLPLDGDLRGLDADVRLDLNQVAYQLLPGLEGLGTLAAAAAPGGRTVTLPPLSLPIRQGVVRYEALPLEIEGVSLSFRGSFDLKTLELDLSTDVPLSLLGSTVTRELDKVRDYIDPSTFVPIRLEGTWSKPRLSVGKEFLESALEQAAQGALRRGLEGLLDRNKKKDG